MSYKKHEGTMYEKNKKQTHTLVHTMFYARMFFCCFKMNVDAEEIGRSFVGRVRALLVVMIMMVDVDEDDATMM